MNKEQRTKNKKLFTVHCSLFTDSGITLVELLIAMAIITILAAVSFGNFTSTLIKGRDSRRKQDLEAIGKAVELYYNDMKAYPTSIPAGGTSFVNPNDGTVIYMQKIPTDPQNATTQYCLLSTDGTYFQLYTRLENQNDPSLIPTITCNSINGYNYGLSSPNTTP
ncbi:prepilin-type N-terminal cleavage/methylation domain-containing protein [Candidatus Gottesmanbacteria bacterium]|nr:prepilin-type N-terminal cleavage/methylation domain-containing protein [Candidatus Gottesmanbacteria bacterium]